MRITSKGQVTIPIGIREQSGLLPNTDVEFRFDGDVVTLHPLRPVNHGRTRGDLIVAHLRKYQGTMTMRGDELLDLTRGE
ncbi:AbrB/MazE/SpoVT family DNA-binding domain-containing protein [soil metagenome]